MGALQLCYASGNSLKNLQPSCSTPAASLDEGYTDFFIYANRFIMDVQENLG